MSWKNYLFFSKGEKNGVLVLILLIVVVIIANRMLPYYFNRKQVETSDYQFEIENFKSSLELKNEFAAIPFTPEASSELFVFDPNRLDSLGFVRLGVPHYLITRILKYRSKGGVFRQPEDFADIYGVKEELYVKLLPYILIESKQRNNRFSPEKKEKYTVPVEVIELNSADTVMLKKLRGIGTVYAGRIVKYRNYLGGFYRVEQLKEVYGVSEELFRALKPYLTVDNSTIRKIRLNGAELNTRLRHPYLNKEQRSALILFRQKNQTISSFQVLKELDEFSDEDWERLIPYLSLE